MRLELISSFFQVKRNILLKKKNMRGRRTCWVKKGPARAWLHKFLNKRVMDSDWLENFRIPKTSFEELVNILRPYLQKQVTQMRKPIYQQSIKLLLSCITSVTKSAIVRQQMLLLYHVVRCHL